MREASAAPGLLYMAAGCDAGACHLDLPDAAAASAPRADSLVPL